MALRSLILSLARRVATAAERDDLFEQPGERPRAAPMEASPAAARRPGAAERVVRPGERRSDGRAAPAVVAAPLPKPAARTSAAAVPATVVPAAPVAVSRERPREGCAPVDLDGLIGMLRPSGRPLVVNHWATWCEPCVDELPRLVRAAAGCGELADFLGVSWDLFDNPGDASSRAKEVAAFADSAGVGYPSVLYTGAPEALFTALGLRDHRVPQTLVYAPDGRVVWHKTGVLEHDDVFPLISAVKSAAGTP